MTMQPKDGSTPIPSTNAASVEVNAGAAARQSTANFVQLVEPNVN
jgi:hypothetical protein